MGDGHGRSHRPVRRAADPIRVTLFGGGVVVHRPAERTGALGRCDMSPVSLGHGDSQP